MTTELDQQLLDLSQQKWDWMSAKNVEALAGLFHDEAVFVHMGATMQRDDELNVIREGMIHYKTVDISKRSVRFVSPTTAIVLNTLRLVAVVGGNEVENPFEVTEVYVQQDEAWKLAAMAFTRLLTPPPAEEETTH